MRLHIHAEARAELIDAAVHYADENLALAERFISEIESALQDISLFPKRFRIYRNTIRVNIRVDFPYSIYFSIEPDEILVISISHQARDQDHWLGRLRKS